MGLRSGLPFLLLAVVGCGQAVTARNVEGRKDAYEIECVQQERCVKKAHEVCGDRYEVLAKWEHPLVLPDVQPGSRDYPLHFGQQGTGWESYSSNTGPSDAATAPPLRRLDVACVN